MSKPITFIAIELRELRNARSKHPVDSPEWRQAINNWRDYLIQSGDDMLEYIEKQVKAP